MRSSEREALENNQIISHVTGKNAKIKISSAGKMKSLGAMGFIMAMIVVFAVLFSSGNLIPSAISERLIEETDVQYADAVESKKLVFQQAMQNGELPENTVEVLKNHGVEVEKASNGEVVLKTGDKTITAGNFINEVNNDVNLYNAFNSATYGRAAYYYDESAEKVFEEIGDTRNNYTKDSDFDEVMDSLLGSGSNVTVSNVGVVEKTREVNGKIETYTDYEATAAVSSSGDAGGFISGVANNNWANSTTEATLNSADSLKVADTVSKEQRSALFFLGIMENISKMKGGEGNESKINEAMNYLYEVKESEVVDIKTGEVIKVKGSAMESPSLYALLAGSKVNMDTAGNYSSDRVLKTVENRLNAGGSSAISGTVASTDEDVKGSVGRFLNGGEAGASIETLNTVNQTINGSLIENSYETISGIDAGEFLVEGAVNVGKRLAKASGATAGDSSAVVAYARLSSEVLAMDAAADRLNLSPFDVSSRNTFLGSIFYSLAVASMGFSGSLSSGLKVMSSTVGDAVLSLLPNSYADAAEGYLTQFGDCETYGTIGAVGSAHCAEIATFDPSTLNNTFNDPGFVGFVNTNTTLDGSGKRTINSGSTLANFILYNDERKTPLGVVDGGILDSLAQGSSEIPFVSDILSIIKIFLGASEEDKRVASGAAYVNSNSNADWQTYKYAQRYVSLARATESLRQYAGGSSAYDKIAYFEGGENPVVAFLNEYYKVANR